MSNKTYDALKMFALTLVPIVNFIFLILTTFGKIEGQVATTIIGGLDVLVGAIVTAAREVYSKQQLAEQEAIEELEEEKNEEEE